MVKRFLTLILCILLTVTILPTTSYAKVKTVISANTRYTDEMPILKTGSTKVELRKKDTVSAVRFVVNKTGKYKITFSDCKPKKAKYGKADIGIWVDDDKLYEFDLVTAGYGIENNTHRDGVYSKHSVTINLQEGQTIWFNTYLKHKLSKPDLVYAIEKDSNISYKVTIKKVK